MNTVIYLSNEEVRAVVFRRKGRKLEVAAVYSEQAPDGSIINGQVMQDWEFTKFLKYFWEKHGLPRRKITLVIGSVRIMTKTIVIPRMSHRRIMEYLPREFASMGHAKDPVYTCHIFREQEKRIRVLAVMAERGFLQQHIRRFESLGISVCSISVGIMENIKWLGRFPQIQGKTCVVQILEGRDLFSILFVKGDYCYFTSTKIFGDKGTSGFGSEAGLAFRVIKQFLNAQIHGEPITHVYLGGGFQKEDLEVCRKSMGYEDGLREISLLNQESICLAEVSGISASWSREDLLYQYRRNSEAARRRREILRCFAPAAALACLLAVVAAFQAAVWCHMSGRADRLMDEAGSAEMMERVMAYDRFAAECERLDSRLAAVEQGMEHIRSYPVFSSRVRERLDTCSNENLYVQMKHYDGVSGAVSVDVISRNAYDIAPFIDRLVQQEDLFASVSYEGFQYDAREQVWKSHVVCYLAVPQAGNGPARQEEVEP